MCHRKWSSPSRASPPKTTAGRRDAEIFVGLRAQPWKPPSSAPLSTATLPHSSHDDVAPPVAVVVIHSPSPSCLTPLESLSMPRAPPREPLSPAPEIISGQRIESEKEKEATVLHRICSLMFFLHCYFAAIKDITANWH
ncbi:hypothetical protein RIF29_10600 [Crotalaria pallida]|uniref:Uncharacterized protein n=1 Tax=Crotalaria pallida TaxID=3830 RepID=A0AAN9FSV5_CROPI